MERISQVKNEKKWKLWQEKLQKKKDDMYMERRIGVTRATYAAKKSL